MKIVIKSKVHRPYAEVNGKRIPLLEFDANREKYLPAGYGKHLPTPQKISFLRRLWIKIVGFVRNLW